MKVSQCVNMERIATGRIQCIFKNLDIQVSYFMASSAVLHVSGYQINELISQIFHVIVFHFSISTVFLRFSAPGCLLIFEVFGGAHNRAGALIKTYENLDLPFPAHTQTLIVIYDY